MKRWIKENRTQIILCAALAVFFIWILNGSIGWCAGDNEVLETVMKRYTIGGHEILGGTYELTSGKRNTVWKQYRVELADVSGTCTIRVHGISRRHLLMTGPEMRVCSVEVIGAIAEWPEYRVERKQ